MRDDIHRRATIVGTGSDRLGSSRAAGELEYTVEAVSEGARVSVAVRAVLAGPLAQFSRSGIVHDFVARMTATFAQNIEAQLRGTASDEPADQPALAAGSLIWQVIIGRVKRALAKALGRGGT